jgi:hypothetical protein
VRTKFIIAGAVVLVVLFLTMILVFSHKPPQEITVRHVASFQTDNLTTMTFEITNHTADHYVFFPFEVQIRNGNTWTKFQGWSDISKIHPIPKIDPKGIASYTVNVTNLPDGSVVRFSIRPQKMLMGFDGFLRRAELNLKSRGRGGWIPLNPNAPRTEFYGRPTEVTSEEWVETVK